MKIAFLGASGTQLSPIQYAVSKGYETITIDNIPSNPGHQLSDKYFNVSITDKEKVLEICRTENIDGVVGYASDLASITQAFIAKKLFLVGSGIETNSILVNKDKFREYLKQEELQDIFFQKIHLNEFDNLFDIVKSFPESHKLIIKPTDSAGSKGVYIFNAGDFDQAIAKEAFNFSISKTIIIESFLEKLKPQVCGDGFMYDNKLAFIDYGDGYFHDFEKSPVPYGETFPGTHSPVIYQKIGEKLEEILCKLNYQGPFNFDVFVLANGEIFINEIGPRSGGNFIPDIIGLKNGFDFVGEVVEFFLGRKPSFPEVNNTRGVGSYMIHSHNEGIYKGVILPDSLMVNVVKKRLFINPNDKVTMFHSGNHSIGNLILEFTSVKDLPEVFKNFYERIEVQLLDI